MTHFILCALLHPVFIEMSDWQRFPSEAVCKHHAELAESFLCEVKWRMELGGYLATQLCDVHDAALDAKAFWHAASWVTYAQASFEQRYENARIARSLIGDAAYYSGRFPDPVPMWAMPWLE